MIVRPGLSSVLLAGGGSAGHVSPLLALADCLRRRDPDLRVTALGTQKGLDSGWYRLGDTTCGPFRRWPSPVGQEVRSCDCPAR